MKRRLIVMRHAKSSWKQPTDTDHQRPLNKRGRRDASRVAQEIGQLGWVPQVVLSSDSQRTRETAKLLQKAWSDGTQFEFLPTLYHAGIDEIVEELSAVPNDVECVLVLGHNPGWEGAVLWLAGEDTRMTTATAALLQGAGDSWQEAVRARKGWKISQIVRPKELDD